MDVLQKYTAGLIMYFSKMYLSTEIITTLKTRIPLTKGSLALVGQGSGSGEGEGTALHAWRVMAWRRIELWQPGGSQAGDGGNGSIDTPRSEGKGRQARPSHSHHRSESNDLI